MLILGIETSTPRSSVALVDEDRVVLASTTLGVPQRHGEFLASAIRFLLDHAGVTVADLTGVAVGTGPGLYTGLRVGIATAQAIGWARRLPAVGLSGLDVLAFQARHARRLLCPAVDARRGELFWAFYRSAPGGVQRQGEVTTGEPGRLVAEIEGAGEECLLLGDGPLAYRRDFEQVDDVEIAGPALANPEAADLAELAVPRFIREETIRPGELRPSYLRRPDAKVGWETRGALQGGTT